MSLQWLCWQKQHSSYSKLDNNKSYPLIPRKATKQPESGCYFHMNSVHTNVFFLLFKDTTKLLTNYTKFIRKYAKRKCLTELADRDDVPRGHYDFVCYFECFSWPLADRNLLKFHRVNSKRKKKEKTDFLCPTTLVLCFVLWVCPEVPEAFKMCCRSPLQSAATQSVGEKCSVMAARLFPKEDY